MKKNQNYPVEFRAKSVELATEQNLRHQEATARLGTAKGSLSNWVRTAKRPGKRVGGTDAMPPTVAKLQGKVVRGASCRLLSKALRAGASSACSRARALEFTPGGRWRSRVCRPASRHRGATPAPAPRAA